MIILKRGDKGEDVKTLQRAIKAPVTGVFDLNTDSLVRAFQNRHGLKADGMVGKATWAALGITILRSKRKINELIVHCTATKEGVDYTVDQIRAAHKQRGFSDIGYHYVVYRDGSIHLGRDVDIIGAHCEGHNANSIGIAYVGGLDKNGKAKDTRTPAQKAALISLLKELKRLYPNAKIIGHRSIWGESNPSKWKKMCPCFNAISEYSNLK